MPKKAMRDLFIDRRVAVDPVPLSSKKKGTIMYRGLLSASGADAVYLYSGYGDNWQNAKITPMTKIDDLTWSTDVMIEGDKTFNFCFKDGADHWDNNAGLNWSVEIV
ncbi:MAG: carbohydrate-binding protein [Bacillota bacterium]